jgi:nucleotide-binding universal stress UspA family protein
VREVLRGKYDLLVRYHGRDVKKGQPLGEVDHQLLRKCPCPVWLVGVGEKTRPKRVLAAVHPESADEAAQELNRRIIRAAAEVTGLERGKLTVMTAWAPFGLSLMDDRLTKRELSEVKSLAHDRAALELDRLLSTVGEVGVPYKAELVQGDPAKAIAALVKKEKIDLVVMGTVARSGLIGAIMGNTAERMIRTIRASLLALKPVDFKCPIRPE